MNNLTLNKMLFFCKQFELAEEASHYSTEELVSFLKKDAKFGQELFLSYCLGIVYEAFDQKLLNQKKVLAHLTRLGETT